MRKEKKMQFKFDIENSKVKFIAGGAVAGILIILVLFLSIASSVRKKQALALLAREQQIMPTKSRVESVNNELTVLKSKMTALEEIRDREFLWARKLNSLSDLILPGIWFRHIYTDSDNRFVIEGCVISKKEEAMASVGKFMKGIRDDSEFFKYFVNIKLESVQRNNIEERDVVDFKIALYFRGP